MTKLMLSIHVLVAVMFIGPVTVAASLFPRFARQALTAAAATAAGGAAGPSGSGDADATVPPPATSDETQQATAARTAAAASSAATSAAASTTASSTTPAASKPAPEAAPAAPAERAGSLASVLLLHRISRVYALLSASVPILGMLTAQQMGVMGDTWLIASMVLTLIAAVLLGIAVLGYQQGAVMLLEDDAAEPGALRAMAARMPKLGMVTGFYALTWAVVVVLMVVRPGSTTGA